MTEASIKDCYLHSSIVSYDLKSAIIELGELEKTIKSHIKDRNLTCIGLKISLNGDENRKEIEYTLVSVYNAIMAENAIRLQSPEDYDGQITLGLDCDEKMYKIVKAKAGDSKNLKCIDYGGHINGCKRAYEKKTGLVPEHRLLTENAGKKKKKKRGRQ